MMKYVLAITTYNRLPFLSHLINTWQQTRAADVRWKLIVSDDGSTDGSVDFLKSVDVDKVVFENKRHGMAYQTNLIFKELSSTDFDICFKCDDDIFFNQPGWDHGYYEAINRSGFQHLCYENPLFNTGEWCKDGRLQVPVYRDGLIALVKKMYVKGCMYTVTPEILQKVGYMDPFNFFHGMEHIDFAFRCGRAGFCDPDLAFDWDGSNAGIAYRFPWNRDQPVLAQEAYEFNDNYAASAIRKRRVILSPDRIYVPYSESSRRMVNNIAFLL